MELRFDGLTNPYRRKLGSFYTISTDKNSGFLLRILMLSAVPPPQMKFS